MANRRMFSLDIIDSDKFLDMPQTAQVLYFHLGMRADDDGFIGNPKRIQRMIGSSDDDFKLLMAKGFIIPFENGVCVIRHWKIHNYIRSDRYKKTIYRSEMDMLLTLENGEYVFADTAGIPSDNHLVYQMDTQVRLVKDKNISCSPDGERECENEEKSPVKIKKNTALQKDKDDFEKIYAAYPKKRGKAKAFEYYRGYVGKGRTVNGTRYHLTPKQIYLSVAAYVEEKEGVGTEISYFQDFSTFMNKTVLDYLPEGEEG